MKLLYYINIFSCIFFLNLPVYPQTNNSPYIVEVSFIKQNYLGSEPINIMVTIINYSDKPLSFSLADNFVSQSINFELRTSQNTLVPINNMVMAKLSLQSADPSLYRDITLLPKEAFSKSFNIRDYYTLTESRTYYIQAKFYPDPDNQSIFYLSDFQSFAQTTPLMVQQQIIQDDTEQQRKILELQQLLPNEVIASFFESQKNKNWTLFLLHIDPERLIYSFPNFSKQYDNAVNGTFKLNILDQFKRFFTANWNIALTSYKIKETIIEDDTATVIVDAVESIRFTNRRLRYTFTLYKTGNNSWIIDNYTVLALN